MKKYKFYAYVNRIGVVNLTTETTDDVSAKEFCRQTMNRLFDIRTTYEVRVECYSVETGELVYRLKMVAE